MAGAPLVPILDGAYAISEPFNIVLTWTVNELPPQQAVGYQRPSCKFFRFPSPPNVFIGGPSGLAWIPANAMRE
jgi:hypothetical protein